MEDDLIVGWVDLNAFAEKINNCACGRTRTENFYKKLGVLFDFNGHPAALKSRVYEEIKKRAQVVSY